MIKFRYHLPRQLSVIYHRTIHDNTVNYIKDNIKSHTFEDIYNNIFIKDPLYQIELGIYLIENNYCEIFKSLWPLYEDPHCEDNLFYQVAVSNKKYDLAKYFIYNGVNASTYNNYAIKTVAGYTESADFLEFLINCGCDITVDNNYPVRNAAYQNILANIELLVSHGADIHADNDFCIRAVCYDIESDKAIVEYLLSIGANPNVDNNYPLCQTILLTKLTLLNYC